MPLPTSYTEPALAAFLVVELGTTASLLGWVPGTPRVAEAVADAELMLGVADVVSATDLPVVRALGRLAIWRAAMAALSPAYDQATDGQSVKRSQLFDHAQDMVSAAEDACARLGVGDVGSGTVLINGIERSQDPYAVPSCIQGDW